MGWAPRRVASRRNRLSSKPIPTGPTETLMDDEGNEHQIQVDGVMALCADIDSIPTFTVRARKFWEKHKSCPICLDNLAEGDLANKLPCGHIAHAMCMEQWLATDRTCPACHKQIFQSSSSD